jgi:cytosine/adenosine deaminase-related metal-dependent hydrolase
MNITTSINIQQISNGFVVGDGYGGQCIDTMGLDRSETRFYATMEDLAADAGRFVREAMENATARMREYEDRRKAEEAQFAALGQAPMTSVGGKQ